jgi:prepilin signal peptidase PulO-like enzyme (type II secretory pathway)
VSIPPELLSPWVLGLLGLCIGSFLNVVVYRLPLMLERQWWADVAHQLGDAQSWTWNSPFQLAAFVLLLSLVPVVWWSLRRRASRAP